MRVTINGAGLEVDVQGDPDAPVLIAHHGGPGIGDRRDLTTSFGAFADRFRVITFDARGSGESEEAGPYTHEQWAADIDSLREWAGVEQFVMAGHSYGGIMALEYVTRYPNRVSALLLVDTGAADTFREISRKRAAKWTASIWTWRCSTACGAGRCATTTTSATAGARSSRSTR